MGMEDGEQADRREDGGENFTAWRAKKRKQNKCSCFVGWKGEQGQWENRQNGGRA